MPQMDAQVNAKRAAGKAAADLVQNGMVVGLGTGSTAAHLIASLIERVHQGLKIQAVATSRKSMEQAMAGGIPILNIDEIEEIDLTVDGADQIDQKKRMIKGGGGALLREKVVANMSHEMVVIVDESKLVKYLGNAPLPVEILPFAYHATIHQLNDLGFSGKLREIEPGMLFITENHNYIYDIHLEGEWENPSILEMMIRDIPGVMGTGLFIGLAGRVVIGYNDGHVEIRT